MPAGKARSPRAGPDLHAVCSGRLPESEVTRVTLAWIGLAARAGQQLFGRVTREAAVRREACDVVVDRPIDFVRVSLL